MKLMVVPELSTTTGEEHTAEQNEKTAGRLGNRNDRQGRSSTGEGSESQIASRATVSQMANSSMRPPEAC